MNIKTLQILDIVYFLVSQYGYEQINLIGKQDEFWLFNPRREKYTIVRLTADDMSTYKENKDRIVSEAEKFSKLYNVPSNVLSIHFSNEEAEAYFEPDFIQAQVNENLISPILKDEFRGIESALKPITKDFKTELDERHFLFEKYKQQRIAAQREKPLKNMKSNFKFKWTYVIILINLLVFMGMSVVEVMINQELSVIFFGAIYKPLIYGANDWWRILAAGFVHFDVFHLIVNMFALMQIGSLVERVYGKKQMLFIYFTSIITSSLLALVTSTGSTVTAGASGGIFGLIGAVIVYLFTSGLYKIPAIRNSMIQTIVVNLLISILPGISMFGHLGGLIGGTLASMFVSKAKSLKSAKISSLVSLVFVIVAMVTFGLTMDDKFFPTNVKFDENIVKSYEVLGMKNRANRVESSFEKYYEEIGESYR